MEKKIRTLKNKFFKRKKAENKPLYTIDKNIDKWIEAKGDETLRLDYDLREDSVVFDVGGYHGDWATDIFCKYGCFVHIFEPVQKFVDIIQTRFSNNNKIFLHHYGMGAKDESIEITIDEDASSIIKSSENTEKIKLINAIKVFKDFNIEHIDLMKINIEGGEYDLLEYFIRTDLISKIHTIQVQFHEFVPDAVNKMKSIQQKLSETHELTYQFEFIWENWRIKQNVLSR